MIRYFPFNYFWVGVSPKRIFSYRHYLTIVQSVFVFLFLSSLLLIPATMQLAKHDAGQLDYYAPQAIERIDESVWSAFKQSEDKLFENSDHFLVQLGGEFSNEGDESQVVVWLGKDQFILKDPQKPKVQGKYSDKEQLITQTSLESFKKELSSQWSQQYALPLRLFNLMIVAFLIGMNLLLLIAGSTFFLSLMRKSDTYTINTIKEAFTLTLNSLMLPTVLTFVLGWFMDNLVALLTIHGLAFVLTLVASYWRTHFNDDYLKQSTQ